MFETHLTVIGTLITNVSRRRLADGGAVVNFRVASNERRFDRATAAWTDGDSLYVSVTCWRQLAENVHRTFTMGDPIIVRGRLRTRNYEDKEGRRQTVIELEGLAVGPDLTRATAAITRLRRDGTPPAPSPRGSDDERAADGDPDGDSGHGSDLGSRPMSDDPWQIADDAPDGLRADREEPAGDRDPAVEAAVGA